MKTRISDVLLNSLLYAVYMVFSCIVVMFAEILALKIVNLFVVVDNLSLCIIRVVVYSIGVCAILAIVSFREGYKSAPPSALPTAVSALIALILHFIPSLLFNFAAFCSGGVRFIAILAKFGDKINNEHLIGTLTRADCIPYFFLNGLVYVIIMVSVRAIGASIRLRDRELLCEKKQG